MGVMENPDYIDILKCLKFKVKTEFGINLDMFMPAFIAEHDYDSRLKLEGEGQLELTISILDDPKALKYDAYIQFTDESGNEINYTWREE